MDNYGAAVIIELIHKMSKQIASFEERMELRLDALEAKIDAKINEVEKNLGKKIDTRDSL